MNQEPVSPATSSPTDSPSSAAFTLASEEFIADDDLISHDLAVLEQLRRNIHQNLKLRPIRSSSTLPSPLPVSRPSPPPSNTFYELRHPRLSFSPEAYDPIIPLPYDPTLLLRRLSFTTRPLLIDTRPAGSYLASRIQHSVNLAIPSLIIKRCRKPNTSFTSIVALRAFISTDRGKDIWDNLMNPAGPWNGDVVVYDEEMDERDPLAPGKPTLPGSQSSTAWILLSVLAPLVHGQVFYLRGGISAARRTPEADLRIVSGEREAVYEDDEDDDTPAINLTQETSVATGLFSLRTDVAARSRPMPEIEPQSASSPVSSLLIPDITPPIAPSLSVSTSRSGGSSAVLKVDMSKSNGGPPKLSLRTGLNTVGTSRPSHTAAAKLPRLRLHSVSPSNLTIDNDPATPKSLHSPPLSSPSSFHTAPRSPFTPSTSLHSPTEPFTPLPPSPHTARPLQSPTSPPPIFTISTILPNFLYLGPELVLSEHVKQLKELGVKRILNIAIECDDDLGLNLRKEFERYDRVPMRDTVEEVNVARGMQEVCSLLDDARLHSSPTYVHCKAGKSRSVTAVMAYLIHANHWALSKAYAFVLERRKGISPNIGFVSELMNFEEAELGGKSVGVVRGAATGESGVKTGNYGHAVAGRRQGHMRESLPPILPSKGSGDPTAILAGQMSAGVPGGNPMVMLQGQGEEMEVRDGTGRYRHARRAPVDELTLQPMRRVSKAGLESTSWA